MTIKRRDFVKQTAVGGALLGGGLQPLVGDDWINDAQAAIEENRVVGQDIDRHAIVIGNGAYRHTSPLLNPPNDARVVASVLRELNFRIDYVEDGDYLSLHDAVESHLASVRAGEVTLFFFAGHGVQVDGRNFLLPVDIKIESVDDLVKQSLSFDWCIEKTASSGSEMAIFILDACRDNPFEGVEGALGSGLASVSQAQGETFIAYAAAAGAVAYDDSIGGTGNSPFTSALVNALERPGRDIFEVFREVRAQVREATQGNQLPWLSTSLERSFVFRPDPNEALPDEKGGQVDGPVADTARIMWDAIRNGQNPEEIEDFLDRFPDSRFEAQAKEMLDAIVESDLPKLPAPIVARAPGLPEEITNCDLLAAHPYDSQRVADGLINALVNTRLAIRECSKALADDPENPRLMFQLGRVLNIREQWDDGEAYLIKAAEKDYAAAYTFRAGMYIKGISRPKDFDLSFELLTRAAELGDVSGQLGVGRAYLEGWGTEPSLDRAVFWMETSAARNFPPAIDRLGTLYARGRHIEKNDKLAVFYYQRAASLGSSNAMNSLARFHLQGRGVEKSPAKAIDMFKEAIARGNIFAPYHLAKMYRDGWGVEADVARAIELYRLAAERGFAGGWIELARIYAKGEGVEKDSDSAYFYAYIAKEIALQRSDKDPIYKQAQAEIEVMAGELSLENKFELDRRAERWLDLNGPNLRRTRDAFK